MNVDSLFKRYALHARALGYSPKTVVHVQQPVSSFANFLSGVPDVKSVTADDPREYIVGLHSRPRWEGQSQEKDDRLLSATSVNTYVRGIKSFWPWLHARGIIGDNALASVRARKLP